jgi:phosphate starvation-inducible PhoH-like protein
MLMFLTRLGEGSQCIVTGDPSQIDLRPKRKSGLLEAIRLLEGVEGISFTRFTDADVVRHPVVARIIKVYDDGREGDEG